MFNLENAHPSWHAPINKGLSAMDPGYLAELTQNPHWLPGPQALFNAFSKPLLSIRYILWGESPYPRAVSANGYAFWDNAVTNIWSTTGLSKPINRATSLRNLLKMLLVARGDLVGSPLEQSQIAALPKTGLIQQLSELFDNLLSAGFLLLNASLVLGQHPIKQEAKYWQPFMSAILQAIAENKQPVQLVLLGNIAQAISKLAAPFGFSQFVAEHPYNISFIHNPDVLNFFRPFDLLDASF